MKIILSFVVALLVLIFIVALVYVRHKNNQIKGRGIIFNKVLGNYILDTKKTNLGSYSKDSNLYKKLTIEFNSDSTFRMNMKVPFLFDSIGTWKAGNFNEWNWIQFKRFQYDSNNINSGSQFTKPYTEGTDTYFLLTGATPRNGAYFIEDIFFRKIH